MAAVIKARGLSSALSAANGAVDHVKTWLKGTTGGDWTSFVQTVARRDVEADQQKGRDDGRLRAEPRDDEIGRDNRRQI